MRRMIAGAAFLGYIGFTNIANADGCYCYGLFTDENGIGEYYYVSEAFEIGDSALQHITECSEERNFINYIEGRYNKRLYTGPFMISGCIPSMTFSDARNEVNALLSRARQKNYDDVSAVPFK